MRQRIVAAFLCGVIFTIAAFAQSSNIQYFYDDLGRLVRVVDQSGNVATYTYDAVGNILKISRTTLASPTTLAILNFTPSQGGVGTSVTIQGQGFNPTASLNTVSFNGTSAPVVSATGTTLVATVPANATTGPISVTANGQTATSDTNFTFIPAPAVLSINPKFVVTSPTPTVISNFVVTGAALNGATFTFQPAAVPPTVAVTSITADPSGTSATLSISIAANAAGSFTLVVTNGSGSSSQVPSAANTLHVISPNGDEDNDGLTNAVEIALGTDPFNASTAGDGITDGWKVFYGLDPFNPIANQDPDGDGLSNLQEFQAGTDPRNPGNTPPAVAEISPADQSTNVALNGKVVVRFTEPLLNGVNLNSAQAAITRVSGSLTSAMQTTAAQVLQAYLQRTCCATSIVPGIVTLVQGTTPVGGSVQLSNDGLSVTFAPAQQLLATTAYSVQVNGVRDVAGNQMTAAFQSSFTTGTSNDVTQPVVIQTSPTNGATSIPTNVTFTLQFSKRIDPSTLDAQSFTIQDSVSGLNAVGTVQVDASGLTAAFMPEPALGVGRTFFVRLNATRIKDTFGNSLTGPTFFSFTTAFSTDTDVPHLVGTSPLNGDTNIPTNSVIVLKFNEPLNSVNVPGNIQVSAGGNRVAGSIALSDGNRQVTFTPATIFPASTTVTVEVGFGITDVADHLIDNPGSFSFQTGNPVDTVRASVVAVSPLNGAANVPANAAIQVQFSKRVDALTVTGGTLRVFPVNGNLLDGAIVVSPDGQSATFAPTAGLLASTTYIVQATGGITDLEGQGLSFFQSSFTTGVSAQAAGPQVIAVSPQDGSTGAPVNARVDVQVNEAIEPLSVTSSAIQVSAAGVPVAGTVSLSSDRKILTFTPSSPLAVSTAYSVTVSGFEDVAGNPVTPFSSSFTTGTSGVADTALLAVQSVSPLNGVTGVPVNTAIALTFNKAVDPTTVSTGTVPITASGFSGNLAGTYAVNGAVVSFTPLSPLPGNTRINIEVVGGSGGVRDVAGNTGNFFFSSFTTGAGTDTTAPAVVSVTPSDGAATIGLNAGVVLTFSKALNPVTVNTNTFALFANGNKLGMGTSISADNRTVTLSAGTLPASSVVTVVATSGVKDLSGNSLPDFRSQFTTTLAPDTSHASVVSQRPGNGASGVALTSSVVVYVNEPLDTSTITSAFHLSQNGTDAPGTVSPRDNGQTLEFQPAGPWLNNALVQVFLDSTALDVDGSPVNSYQGSFRTVVDTTTVAPAPVSLSPGNGATNIAENAVIEIGYNEPLNPNSVNVNTVLVRQNVCCAFPAVAGTITLDASGRLIRFVSTVPLLAGTSYLVQTSNGIQGTNGLTQTFTSSTSFTTGTAQDTVPPVVTLVSPPDGSVGVPVNGDIHVRFNEAVNPLTVNAGTIQVSGGGQTAVASSISFSNGNQEVVLTPQEPFPDNTQMTVTITGVEDLAGNHVVGKTTQFTSGAGPATAQPAVVEENPFSGAVGVATNTVVQLETSVAVDPGTVNGNTFVVRDNVTGQNVAGSYTVSADGRTLSFVANAPLAVSRSHTVIFTNGLTDLAGNVVGCAVLCNYSFTTGTLADPNAPQVAGVSPADQLTGVPINAQVVIGFNEPVNQLTLGQVTLSSGGTAVSVVRTLANGQTTLILTPVVPLQAGTVYTVTVAGVQDLSGNALAAATTTTFTTGPGADLVRAVVTTVSPANGATLVPTNAVIEVQFSKRVDALTVTGGTLRVFPVNGNLIDGAIIVSPDGQSATFTPSAPLVTETTYIVQATNGITDLEGQGLSFFQSSFTTGTGAQAAGPQVIAVSPQDGSTGAPVNARVDVQVNEAIEPLSVTSSAIQISAAGVPVAGSVTLSSDRTVLTFTPSSPLTVSTVYAVTVSGFTDVAGNPVTPFSSSFTTGTSGVADTTLLAVQSVSPLNGATGVPVNTAMALTFNKAVDPTTVNTGTVPITASGFSGNLAGTYAVNGTVMSFTPLSPLPGNTRINIEVVGGTGGVRDVAGNTGNFFFSSFTTGAGTDTTAPAVVSVTPNDGAINVGRNASVVLTFSKSLNRATVNTNTFGLLDASGVSLGFGISVSADNQTVTLSPGTLPASSVVTVVATSGVQDLSGNPLPDFRSQFETTSAFDTTHASVVSQRPGNGASGVALTSSVVVYVNEPLDPASVQNALHVSQNGVLAAGTVTVRDNGQTLEFQPAGPWLNNALVQVFLDSTALDVDGSPVNSYQGSFRTAVDTTTVAPAPVSLSPGNGATNIPENAVIEIGYNEPLNPNSVNVNTVLVRQNVCCAFPAVAGTITLDASGRLIRFVPTVPLLAGTTYLVQTTNGIQGTNGLTQTFTSSTSFTTGTAQDTVPPVVTLVSPPDGAVGVPVNGDIHVRFNEAINPLTVNAGTIQVSGGGQTAVASSISFSNGNQEVVLTPQEPFPDNTSMTITITAVEDLAGNQVVGKTTQFTSGAGPATAQPAVVEENPFSGAAGVATNTVVQLETSVAVDPGTVNGNTFVVRDNVTGQNVAGSYTVSADGRTLSFVANAPLGVSRSHTVIFTNGITDLAGNVVGCGVLCNYSFTTGTLADPNAPQVVGVSPGDQLTGVPINAQVVIGFNEPVNQLTLGQVTLSSGGTAVSVVRTLANGQTTLILTPVVPLQAGAAYTVTVAGVQDLSGNVLAAATTTTFTTGPGADLVRAVVTTVSPANGATAVPTNTVIEVQFSKRVDALTVTDGTLRVIPVNGTAIPGTVVVSPDGQSATFTATAGLLASTTYIVQGTSGITDLEGQGLSFFQSSFTTGPQ